MKGFREHLQWWVGLLAAALSVAFGYLLLTGKSDMAAPELPAYSCSGKIGHYDSFDIDTYYQQSGCESIDPTVAVRITEELHAQDTAFQQLRLPAMPMPLDVGVYRKPIDGASYRIYGEPGGPRALVVQAEKEIYASNTVAQALAELLLGEGAPGLRPEDRQRLARAYAYLVAPSVLRSDLGGSQRELELIQSRGIDFIPDLLDESCRRPCDWDKVLAEASE